MTVSQNTIIADLHSQREIDPKNEIRRRVEFMKEYVRKTGTKGFVLGISGGQDSTLAGKLAQMAVNELNKEKPSENITFYAVKLPYGKQFDESDVDDAMTFIEPTAELMINIKEAVDASVKVFEDATGEKLSDFNKGNTKARERMKVQYDLAAHYKCLVIGTDHAAEAITGFYTKYGDGACDLAPLVGLTKHQGKDLLKVLNCPPHLYTKIPTADLEDDKPGLPDEDALGMTYEMLDRYLEGREVPSLDAKKIEARYRLSEHKRRLPANVFDSWWR
ncbi:ammonia-dependent NAD(+) synthetase [bacterium LRH843]|nr:ammonia-dependent NAD(+) synthetase [bacterium LRH843]